MPVSVRSGQRGFTMIEVLVTLVIMMIGLLGIAGLMAQGQRASFEAYQRQQALALANDMAERIKANRPGADTTAVTSTYDAQGVIVGDGTRFAQLELGAIPNCITGNCTAADVVRYDVALWDGLLSGGATEASAAGVTIGPILNARGCIQQQATSACAACGAGSPATSRQVTYRVSVAWQGNQATAAPTASACGAGLYQSEESRRLVSVDVYTVIPCDCP